MSMIEPAAPVCVRLYAGASNFDWTDERVEQLKKWWADGWSASQIAAGFNNMITRSAALGKVHRLGLPTRKTINVDQHRERKIKKTIARRIARWRRDGNALKVYQTVTGDIPQLPADHAPNPVGLMELTDATCRWPAFGDGMETVFCGDTPVIDRPYCLHHCRLSYQPPRQRKAV